MGNNLIVKHNNVVEGHYKMTVTEVKIIAKLTSMIDKYDEEFKDHIFKIQDLLSSLNLGTKNHAILEDAIDKLLTRKLEIRQLNGLVGEKEKKLKTTFLSSCLYDGENGIVTLRYDPCLKPYYIDLKNNFTQYNLENIVNLNSYYSCRIYELAKQYQNANYDLSLIHI